jgi:threonine synthase
MGMTIVSLGEGNTPLLEAPQLSERLGCEVWLKWEGANPTGSMKDRGMALAVSRAVEQGALGVVVASTGNTAASAAAYAARAGLPAIVLLPEGAVARGKISQAIAAGAEIRHSGTFEDAHKEARRLAAEEGLVNVNSINPDRIEGQSSAAVEIVEKLGGTIPDVLALPYGGGGNTRAFSMGFERAGAGMPRILAVQSARRADTEASAIRIVEPVHREQAEALAEVVTVTDEELVEWWHAIARLEGVFCELASAAGVAGVAQVRPSGRVVCVLTGHGLKDPDAVDRL